MTHAAPSLRTPSGTRADCHLRRWRMVMIVSLLLWLPGFPAIARADAPSLRDARLASEPAGARAGFDEFLRTALLADYNTRVVVIGTTCLGIAAGVVGTFGYLR